MDYNFSGLKRSRTLKLFDVANPVTPKGLCEKKKKYEEHEDSREQDRQRAFTFSHASAFRGYDVTEMHSISLKDDLRKSGIKTTQQELEQKRRQFDRQNSGILSPKQRYFYFVQADIKDVERELETDMAKGVTDGRVKYLLENYGYNRLDKKEMTPYWKLFLGQFTDFLVIMLLGAAIVAGALGSYAACGVILAIVIANAIEGAREEKKSQNEISSLEDLSPSICKVIRHSQQIEINAENLVPGDVLVLDVGDKCPADGRVVKSNNLTMDEASITGESIGQLKHSLAADVNEDSNTFSNMVYKGTQVKEGNGMILVTETGMKTRFLGKIMELLNDTECGESPLQQRLVKLGKKLGWASLAASIVIFIIGVTTERGADPSSNEPVWLQMFIIAVALTVAAVPEGLPICVTITLASGMKEMAKQGALIKDLRSVETLGSTNIIFSDKTGTLTSGIMSLKRFITAFKLSHYNFSGVGYCPDGEIQSVERDSDDVEERKERGDLRLGLTAAVLCSNAELSFDAIDNEWKCTGNASERALVVGACKAGIEYKELGERVHENPFTSKRKMMSVVVKLKNGETWTFVKGAPNVLLGKCTHFVSQIGEELFDFEMDELSRDVGDLIQLEYDGQSRKGRRCLAVAAKRVEGKDYTTDSLESELCFLGIAAIEDPPRPDVKASIEEAANAGVKTVMVTGDYVYTAASIAQDLSLLEKGDVEEQIRNGYVVDCTEFRKWDKKQQEKAVFTARVFARAKPEDKPEIVKYAQNPRFEGRRKMVCAMTGDGVNDAAALKKANIGIAMASGTDVAKQAANVVLVTDSFVCIVKGIKVARKIKLNIKKFVNFLLSTNVGEVFVILLAPLMGLISPMTAIQILWLNLMTDSIPALALGMEEMEDYIMTEAPEPADAGIVDKIMMMNIFVHTLIETVLVLGVYIVGNVWHTGSWDVNPDTALEEGMDVEVGKNMARTMVTYVIVFLELLRAYSSRSLKESVFSLGVFTNKWLQRSVTIAILITLIVGNVPGAMDVFDMEYLDVKSWAFVLVISVLPFIGDELLKCVYRRTGYGSVKRPVPRADEISIKVERV